jgi:hypothetical protein
MTTLAARIVNASANVSRIRTPLRSVLFFCWEISLVSLLMPEVVVEAACLAPP